jgi:hypothetical protein
LARGCFSFDTTSLEDHHRRPLPSDYVATKTDQNSIKTTTPTTTTTAAAASVEYVGWEDRMPTSATNSTTHPISNPRSFLSSSLSWDERRFEAFHSKGLAAFGSPSRKGTTTPQAQGSTTPQAQGSNQSKNAPSTSLAAAAASVSRSTNDAPVNHKTSNKNHNKNAFRELPKSASRFSNNYFGPQENFSLLRPSAEEGTVPEPFPEEEPLRVRLGSDCSPRRANMAAAMELQTPEVRIVLYWCTVKVHLP